MKRQGLFIELRSLDGSDGPLDSKADEVGWRDALAAHRTGVFIDVGTVIGKRWLAVPMAMKGEGGYRDITACADNRRGRQSAWQALSFRMKGS